MAAMTEDQTIAAREIAEERAAICEYDGLMDRVLAEAQGKIESAEYKLEMDRENYAAYVQDRVENGWSTADVKEYRDEVKRIMLSGTDDEKAAASEFWAHKREQMIGSAKGINERIRAVIEAKKKELG
jgi:phage host-nuclease inhibitor protein Gam